LTVSWPESAAEPELGTRKQASAVTMTVRRSFNVYFITYITGRIRTEQDRE
jgi:hypothetical protein